MAATGIGRGHGSGSPTGSPCPAAGPWNLVDGWLRVEYQNAAGVWVGDHDGVVAARFRPRTSFSDQAGGRRSRLESGASQRDSDIPGTGRPATRTAAQLDAVDAPNNTFDAAALSRNTAGIPINLFDPREGFPRDAAPAGMANPHCYVNGIMNAVELDVGNFKKWLLGTIPGGSGPLVSYSSQNGYLVYFSDRRGMLPDPEYRSSCHQSASMGSKMSSTRRRPPELRTE